jgi:hypothetical protein
MNHDLASLARVVSERCAALDVESIDGCPQRRHAACRTLVVEIAAVAATMDELLRRTRQRGVTARKTAAELFLAQRLVSMNVELILERCPAHRESMRAALTLADELDKVCDLVLDQVEV